MSSHPLHAVASGTPSGSGTDTHSCSTRPASPDVLDLLCNTGNGTCWTCAGVYSNGYDAALNVKNGFPVFTTVIEANFINRQEDRFAAFKLSDEDKQEILKLARDPRIGLHPLNLHDCCHFLEHMCQT